MSRLEAGGWCCFYPKSSPRVLPANQERYSIAGWFRVNGSGNGRLDPPR